jgi:hypothetical protein
MLTPIRVRGKKARHGASSNGVLEERWQPSKVSRPIGGRIMADPGTPKMTLSRLETMPVELIEKIFLSCLEINLPRASPALTAALSSERIYRILILLSFFDDARAWGRQDYATPSAILKMFRPLDYKPFSAEERKSLQIAVLDCRWCTLDRIRKQAPGLLYLTIQRRWFGWYDVVMEENDEAKLNKLIWEDPQQFPNFQGKQNSLQLELQVQPPFALNIDGLDTMTVSEDISWRGRPVSVLYFPTKVLRGKPWTDEKIFFLEFLSKAYGHTEFDRSTSFPFHAAQDGIRDAIVEQNPRALCHLLRLDELFSRIENCRVQKRWFYQLPAEHFRTAVRHSGGNTEILKLLVRASAESIPCDDPEITAWATEAQDKPGDPFGKWLLDLMLVLPSVMKDSNSSDVADRPIHAPCLFMHGGLDQSYMDSEDEIATIHSIFGQDVEPWPQQLHIP